MAGYFEHLAMLDPLIAAKMVEACTATRPKTCCRRSDVPVLILHGTADPFTPLESRRRWSSRSRDARLVT